MKIKDLQEIINNICLLEGHNIKVRIYTDEEGHSGLEFFKFEGEFKPISKINFYKKSDDKTLIILL